MQLLSEVELLRVKSRKGHQKAVVHVANKMLRIVWFKLIRREPYRRCREGLLRVKFKRTERLARSVQT
jgi:hypothetical protein